MIQDYIQARKLGLDAVKKAMKNGTSPFLPVLDSLDEVKNAYGNQKIGFMELPLSRVLGNKTVGRNNAFANNFMPLIESESEFAMKWSALYDSYVKEGIQNPIECFEYMNQYYVLEGNKRVSVSKFGGSVFIPANVTRILPAKTDDPEVIAYYEYLQFFEVTGNYLIVFTEPGEYEKLASLLGQNLTDIWPEDVRNDLKAAYFIFAKDCKAIMKEPNDWDICSAFLQYLSYYPMSSLFEMSDDQIAKRMKMARQELLVDDDVESIDFVAEAPDAPEKTGMLNGLFAGKKYTASNPLNVAFIFDSKTSASGRWLDSHEAGKLYVDDNTEDIVRTNEYFSEDGDIENVLKQAIEDKNEVIFTVSPSMMTDTVKSAIENPNVKFLNCSIGQNHPLVRCYHGKLYEASFLMGILAANTLLQKKNSDERRVGYVARNTSNIGIANINAFAIGVSVMDPECRISLKWQLPGKACNYRDEFEKENVTIYADVEYSNVFGDINRPGVFSVEENTIKFLGAPYYNWGKYYVQIVDLLLNGKWNSGNNSQEHVSTNYWFGLSTGVVDIITAADLPYQTNKLLSFFKNAIVTGGIDPFSGEIHSQNGLVNEGASKLFEVANLEEAIKDGQIVSMNWLNENIDGSFPDDVDRNGAS